MLYKILLSYFPEVKIWENVLMSKKYYRRTPPLCIWSSQTEFISFLSVAEVEKTTKYLKTKSK